MPYVTVSLLPANELAPAGARVCVESEPVLLEGRIVALSVSRECGPAFVVESFRIVYDLAPLRELLDREVLADDLGGVLLSRPRPDLPVGALVQATLRALRPARARLSLGVHVQLRRRQSEETEDEGDEGGECGYFEHP